MTEEVTTEEAPKTFTEDQVKAMLDEHTSGLKSKVEELLGESKAAKAKAREAQEIAQRETEQAAKKTGNIEALEKSWTEKFTARESELTGSLTEKDGIIARLTAGATAKDIASQLALKGSERVLEKIVSERLGVEIVEGQPKVIVKDAAGQRSALTMEDLKKEILSDTALKPILQGTQGSGAGGVGQSGGAGAGNTIAASELEKMTPAQKAAYFKQHPGVSVQT